MKVPIVLVLISALIATPLFADTITLKNGQTYEGEILEKTNEYVKLKTESEVLRIEMSTIAKIKTPEGEYGVDVKAPPALLHPDIVAKAEAAAEAEVNRMLWFGAGCFLNVIGIIVASSVKPSPPHSHLVGKSPEYVATFAEVYEQKAKNIQKEMAAIGCAVNTAACCVYAIILAIAAANAAGEACGEIILIPFLVSSDEGGCSTPRSEP